MLETESGIKPDRSLSPDEAVAQGAAVYADILRRRGEGDTTFSISNVNSHDLGVLGINPQTKKPMRQIMIPRNSKIPVIQSRKFITSKESQKEVVVTVVEGGTDAGHGATRIGKCRVTGLPEGLVKGSPVNVTFKYSSDGRLTVNADLPTAEVRARTIIERASGMTKDDIAEWKGKIKKGIAVKDRIEEEEVEDEPKKPSKAAVVRKAKSVAKPKKEEMFEEADDDADKFELPAVGEKPKKGESFKGIDLGEAKPTATVDDFVLDEDENRKTVEADSGLDSFFGKLEDD